MTTNHAVAVRSNLSAAMNNLERGELPLAALRYKRAVQEWQFLPIDDPEMTLLTFAVAAVRAKIEDFNNAVRELQLRDKQEGAPAPHEARHLYSQE
jgi:hypothetical protein